MSTSRDTKKNDKEKVSSQSGDGNSLRIQQEQQQQQQQQQQERVIHKVLDDTKENIRKTLSEARKEIPRYTQTVNDSQEQTIEAIRDITDDYIESQKEIISLLQSAWAPFMEKTFYNYWIPPKNMTEVYASLVNGFTDNTIAVIGLTNKMISVNTETIKTSIQHTRKNLKELSRIGVTTAKAFEAISRNSVNTRITAKTSE
jgi:2',3'-cyclic-nucleotide 2'-phosphodiesterase (5'-nucleotidase family)